MRVGVYGAGSIGCHVGGRLAAAGAMPVLVGRPSMAQRLSQGIEVTDIASPPLRAAPGQFRFETEANALADCEAVLVCVKSGGTDRAAAELASVLGQGVLVASLQNGVSNAEKLRTALPRQRVLACMVGYNVAQIGEHRFHRGTSGDIAIEDGPGALQLASLLRQAGIPSMIRRDIVSVQWGKLLLNLNNAVNTLSGLPLKAQLRDRQWRLVLAASMAEALTVLRKAGIRPAKVGAAPPGAIPFVLRLPDWLFERVAASMMAIDDNARSSMAEDLERGREPEIDYLNGEIVKLGAKLGMATPVNSRLVEMVHRLLANKPPQHPSAHDVLTALGC